MRKTFIFLVMLFAASVFADEFNGTWGFRFGMPREDALKLIGSKNFEEREWWNNNYVVFKDHTGRIKYGGLTVNRTRLVFKDGKLSEITISVYAERYDIDSLAEKIVEKYPELKRNKDSWVDMVYDNKDGTRRFVCKHDMLGGDLEFRTIEKDPHAMDDL